MFGNVEDIWVKPLSNYINEHRCLEIMSGRGWLCKSLRDHGIDIIGTDNYSWFNTPSGLKIWDEPVCAIENIDAISAVKKYGNSISYLIISWPPIDNIAYRAIKELNYINKNCLIIYIGEDYGGCTADNQFFENSLYIEDQQFVKISRYYKPHNGQKDTLNLLKFKNGKEKI